eukprot:scaffold108_cov157-Chaetoceros_neogracile.AAC.6
MEDQALQDCIITIYPSKESFHKAMRGFVSIAVEYGCAYSIQRDVDDKSGEDNMDHVVKPI